MRVVVELAAMLSLGKTQMKITTLTVAFGLAGALALGMSSPSFAKSKHKAATPPSEAADSVDANSAYGAHTGANQANYAAPLPGYSARPKGMCWVRGGGGGSDMVGSWEHCDSK
jgi:hypothetical protein